MVLITGASGFLGQHLVRYLSAQDEDVRALYHQHKPTDELQKLVGIEWIQCDLLDIDSVENVLKGISEIYHCAGIVSFNQKRHQQMLHFNVEGTANLVNLALECNIRKLVHVSSVAALGRVETKKTEITEDEEWEESKHNSVYGQSKYLSELEVWRAIAEGLNAVIINPGIILGEGDWNEGSANLVKLAYKEFPFYTMGVTSFVDVKDVVKAMYALMQSDINAERFIVSAGNFGYRDVFNLMSKELNKKPPFIKAGSVLTSMIALLSMIKHQVLGGSSIITMETSRNAQSKCYYNNDKLLRTLPGFSYTPIENTINGMGTAFLTDIQ